ncbi:hypothetical protein I5535_17340 [Rhodobacteraceae bacterium F11138]|nr:hypothetical protein [Rhodobacteraceae bacterium F11138]
MKSKATASASVLRVLPCRQTFDVDLSGGFFGTGQVLVLVVFRTEALLGEAAILQGAFASHVERHHVSTAEAEIGAERLSNQILRQFSRSIGHSEYHSSYHQMNRTERNRNEANEINERR